MQKVVGIDIGGTFIKGALVNSQGDILVKERIPTLPERGPEDVLQRVAELVERLAAVVPVPLQELAGIGIGIPGFLDDRSGIAVEVVNVGWKMVNVKEPLIKSLHLPVILENDANAAALGEAWAGAGKGGASSICITLGTGVGGGIILNQRIWRGANHMAGEIGHLVMDPEGVTCNCGRVGCLETFSSATGMLRLARVGLERGVKSGLALETLSTKKIFQAAAAGDVLANSIVAKAADMLGRGLALAADLINPELIIVGGGLAQAGEPLLQPVRAAFKRYALPRVVEAAQIVPALLGNDAGVVGAGRLALQNDR